MVLYGRGTTAALMQRSMNGSAAYLRMTSILRCILPNSTPQPWPCAAAMMHVSDSQAWVNPGHVLEEPVDVHGQPCRQGQGQEAEGSSLKAC